jgi:hypothetical protein
VMAAKRTLYAVTIHGELLIVKLTESERSQFLPFASENPFKYRG